MAVNNSQIGEQKKQLRKQVETERSLLSLEQQNSKSQAICSRAIDHLRLFFDLSAGSSNILYTYLPFRAEVDVSSIIDWCWQQGVRVVAPRIAQSLRELIFHYVTSYEDLAAPLPWGICEPLAETPAFDAALLKSGSLKTCMLIPGIAFDLDKARLGYGGGYYDKYLQQMLQSGNEMPSIIALAYDLQIVAKVPCEKHDFRVDLIITESRTL